MNNTIEAQIVFYCPTIKDKVKVPSIELGADIESDGSLEGIYVYCTCKKFHNLKIEPVNEN